MGTQLKHSEELNRASCRATAKRCPGTISNTISTIDVETCVQCVAKFLEAFVSYRLVSSPDVPNAAHPRTHICIQYVIYQLYMQPVESNALGVCSFHNIRTNFVNAAAYLPRHLMGGSLTVRIHSS